MDDLGGYGPIIIITLWTEAAIALVFVCMRLYTRIWINRVVGWDDFLIAFSCLMLIPYATAVTLAALKGLGRHQVDLTLDNFIYAVKAEVIGQTFGIVGIATSKASVAAFLLRITVITWHKWVLYILLVSVSVSCFICALFDFIRCDPIESIWNPMIPATCWMNASQYTTLSLVVGIISSTADFVLAILPWFILWNLRMKRKEKNLIASSMSLGLFAGVCGVIRTTTVDRISKGRDYSYETVGLILWNSTELTVTILCATIPTLRPLYKSFFRLFTRSKTSRRRRSHMLDDTPPQSDAFKSIKSTTTYTSKSSVIAGDPDPTIGLAMTTDTRSDKSILGHKGERSDGSIVCTDVVYIEFEDRSEPYTARSDWTKRSCQNWEVV